MPSLPICTPIINGQAHHSYPLSIILNYEYYFPWFYSNYINLYWQYDGIPLDFCYAAKLISNNPWNTYKGLPILETQVINWDILSKCNVNIIDFIKNCIETEHYVDLSINELYCPYSNAYNEYDFLHCIMIYGYDDIAGAFNVLCYNNIPKLSMEKLTYGQLTIAFESLIKLSTNKLGSDIHIITKRSSYCYPIDTKLIYKRVKDYLSGENYYEQFRQFDQPPMDYLYGIDVYEGIIIYCENIKSESNKLDLRIFHTLYEHKFIMAKRSEYLRKQGCLIEEWHIDNEFNNLSKKCLIIRNLAIKYNITQNIDIINKIINQINDLKQNDIDACKGFLYLLKK